MSMLFVWIRPWAPQRQYEAAANKISASHAAMQQVAGDESPPWPTWLDRKLKALVFFPAHLPQSCVIFVRRRPA